MGKAALIVWALAVTWMTVGPMLGGFGGVEVGLGLLLHVVAIWLLAAWLFARMRTRASSQPQGSNDPLR